MAYEERVTSEPDLDRPPSGRELLQEGRGTSRGMANPDPVVRAREHEHNVDLTDDTVTNIDISPTTGLDLGTGLGVGAGNDVGTDVSGA